MKNIKIRKVFASLTILSLVLSPVAHVNAITFQGSADSNINVSKYEAYSNTDTVLSKIPSSLEFEPMTYDNALEMVEDENEYFSYLDCQLYDKVKDVVKSSLAEINLTEEDFYLYVEDINTCKVYLLENKDYDKVIGEKEIKINYTGSYNTTDEQYVRNKVNELDFNSLIDYYDMTEEYTEDTYDRKQEEFVSTIKEMVNDDTIDIIATYGSAGGGGYGDIGFCVSHINFFKNNILYHVAYSTSYMVNTIYVSESVEDTDKAYIDYALPKITEFYKENFTINNVEKTTDEYIIEDGYFALKNNGEFFNVNFNEIDEEGNKAFARIIIKKKETEIIHGDLDGNGVITANDASMALDLYKNGNATDEDIKIADMDNSGTITANDASIILDMYKNGK